jgi:hypothetical protein
MFGKNISLLFFSLLFQMFLPNISTISSNFSSKSSDEIFSLLSITIEISVNFSHKPKAHINPLIIFLLLIFILIFKSKLNSLKISK